MEKCEWIHRQLKNIPFSSYPFDLEDLPVNGIYFFYEKGEIWNDNDQTPRIVRIGTHRNNNFRSRINDHYIFNERKMNFNSMKPAPKDRSIFRKNIGRSLLNKDKEEYLKVWNIDFTKIVNREAFSHLRNIEKEKMLEEQITDILRKKFSFRFLIIENQDERMGNEGLERSLIGTIAQCEKCKPSSSWLGNFSPIKKIKKSGLWQVQHLKVDSINDFQRKMIVDAVTRTKDFVRRNIL